MMQHGDRLSGRLSVGTVIRGRQNMCGADSVYQNMQAPHEYLSMYSYYFCFSQHLIIEKFTI